jgi:hypothetical protein
MKTHRTYIYFDNIKNDHEEINGMWGFEFDSSGPEWDSYEHINAPSRSIKGGEFLNQMSEKDSVP